MLTLPEFELLRPRTLSEAVSLLGSGDAMILAGGTDLLPNLKHGLHAPARLVSLRGVPELRQARETPEGGWFLGAGLTLTEVAEHPGVRARYPALAHAASLAAGPQLRNMGTLGGNLCLDTRCMYVNQTRFWRNALGYCLKKDGTVCHVVPAGSRCVAAYSADSPGPILAYGGEVHLVSARGTRNLPADVFFRPDGARNTVREPDEILTGVTLPPPAAGLRSAYQKLRLRQAVDFPLLSVAVATAVEDGCVGAMTVVVGGIGSRPRVVKRLESVHGRALDAGTTDTVARLAYEQCHPLPTVAVDPAWRREVLPVLVRRALGALVPSV